MKKHGSSLVRVLEEAEAAVLKILSSAAEARDYAALDEARGIAEELRRIGSQLGNPAAATVEASHQPKSGRKRRLRNKRAPADYPKFRLEDDSLFKIGWSKKKGREYEQRVPMERSLQIVSVLEKLASKASGLTTVEQILESKEMAAAGNPPSYQVYIVLALLRDRGLLVASGREGYHLPSGLAKMFESLCAEALTVREGGADD